MKETGGVKSTYNILQLQNLIKRDPPSYYEEFNEQYEYYKCLLELFQFNASQYNENVAALVMFLAQVSSHYKEDLKDFPDQIMTLLRQYSNVLDASMRMCFCKALILMRNRGLVAPEELMKIFFELLRCKDKVLRKLIQVHIITDLKNINAKHKNIKVNTVLQNFMFKMLADSNGTAAKVSLDIMIELYRRNVWKDAKNVNAIATACFSKVNKILVASLQFFLGVDEEEDEGSSESEDDTPTVKDVMQANKVNKKSRSRMKALKKTKQVLKKSKKKKIKEVFDFSAIHLLHDAQGMAEKLLKSLQVMQERFEIKLLIMNLISRLIGVHELTLLNYYPLLIRFIQPHQRDVTKILMFAAQAAHEHVPPDVMEPVLRTIANNFITERNSSEVITVGINAIREMCIRCPLAIDQDLLQDLVQYSSYKNNNVQAAARSLIQVFRKINPQMLQRKFRSKPTESTKQLTQLEYGALKAKSFIPGTEALPIEAPTAEVGPDDDKANDSDGSWVDLHHSDDDLSCFEIDEDDEDEVDAEISTPPTKKSSNNTLKTDKTDAKKSEAEDKSVPTEKSSDTTLNTDKTDAKKSEAKNKSATKETNVSEDDQERAMAVCQSRILSQEEFKKLKVAQLVKEVRYSKGKKRKAETLLSEPVPERAELVSLKDIEKLHKMPRQDKETRLATAKEGREEREKFGSRKHKKNPHASKTQKENNKKKAFMMIKHKIRAKVKRSFKDKQVSLRNALIKQKKKRR